MKQSPRMSRMPPIAEDEDGAEKPASPKIEVLSCESSESSGPISAMECDLRNVIEMMGEVSELDQTGKEGDTSELVCSNMPGEASSMLSSAAELTMEEDESCTVNTPKRQSTAICPCSQEKRGSPVYAEKPVATPRSQRPGTCKCFREKRQIDVPCEKQIDAPADGSVKPSQETKMEELPKTAPDKPATVYVCGGVYSCHALPVPHVSVPCPAASCCPVHRSGMQCNQDMYQRVHEQRMVQQPCPTQANSQPCNKKCGIHTRIYRKVCALPKRKKKTSRKQVCSTQGYSQLDCVHRRSKSCEGQLQVGGCYKEPGIPVLQKLPCPPCQVPYEGIVMGPCDAPLYEGPRERVDIYYFDHGNSGYYRTTDRPPLTKADLLLEEIDEDATKFWATVFGYLHIPFSFLTQFVLQIIRFLLYSIVRPLTVGIIQIVSDYLIKPLLSILFNGIIQPILILAYNISTSVRDLCRPYAQAVGYFLKEVSIVVRSLRLVDVYNVKEQGTRC